MDNEKQKQEVIEFLENTYTGAKMMGDEEVMLRASRALLAYQLSCGQLHRFRFSCICFRNFGEFRNRYRRRSSW